MENLYTTTTKKMNKLTKDMLRDIEYKLICKLFELNKACSTNELYYSIINDVYLENKIFLERKRDIKINLTVKDKIIILRKHKIKFVSFQTIFKVMNYLKHIGVVDIRNVKNINAKFLWIINKNVLNELC